MQQRCCKWRPKGHRRRELRVTQRDEVTDTIRTHVLKSTVAILVGGWPIAPLVFKCVSNSIQAEDGMNTWGGLGLRWSGQSTKMWSVRNYTGHVLASWSWNFWNLELTLVKSFHFWELQWPWASHRSYRGPVKTCLEDEHNLVKTVWDLTCTPSEKMAPKLGENFWKFHPD